MKKIIKKWGNSLCIIFTKEESEIYNIKKGDVIEVEIIKKGDKIKK